jgi:hypothetical protein
LALVAKRLDGMLRDARNARDAIAFVDVERSLLLAALARSDNGMRISRPWESWRRALSAANSAKAA